MEQIVIAFDIRTITLILAIAMLAAWKIRRRQRGATRPATGV
jgi:hypothetical protein